MRKVFEDAVLYALGKKGNTHKYKHGKLKENKNITNIQNFLDTLPKDDTYKKLFDELINYNK